MNVIKINISDATLIKMISKGDRTAYNIFLSKYRFFSLGLARKIVSNYPKNSGFTVEDIFAVTFHSVIVSLKNFNPNKGAHFYSYWERIASLKAYKFINDNSYLGKARMFSGSVSLDELVSDSSNTAYKDIFTLSSEEDNHSKVIDLKETEKTIIETYNAFSEIDKKIMKCLIFDKKPKEIQKELNLEQEEVYKRVRKIKRHLQKKMNK